MHGLRPGPALVIGAVGLGGGLAAVLALVRGGHAASTGVLGPAVVLQLAVGWFFVGVGLHAWWRRPDSRTGLLMVVLGFVWLARAVGALDHPVATTTGIALGWLQLAVLDHLLVGYPTGRLGTTSRRVLVGVGYLLALTMPLSRSTPAMRDAVTGVPVLVDPLAVVVVAGYHTVLLVIVFSAGTAAAGGGAG